MNKLKELVLIDTKIDRYVSFPQEQLDSLYKQLDKTINSINRRMKRDMEDGVNVLLAEMKYFYEIGAVYDTLFSLGIYIEYEFKEVNEDVCAS